MEFLKWLAEPAISAALVGAVGFFFRGPLANFFTALVQAKFEAKLEETRSEIRSNEDQLKSINSFITGKKNRRSEIYELRKLDAAEELMLSLRTLRKLGTFNDVLQHVKLEELMKLENQSEAQSFFSTVAQGLNLDSHMQSNSEIEVSRPRLYLSSEALKLFDVYSLVMQHGLIVTKALSEGRGHIISSKENALRNAVTDIYPSTMEGFDKWGETYAYGQSSFIYDRLLEKLRAEVSGAEMHESDIVEAAKIASSSAEAQTRAQKMIADTGIGERFLRKSS